jgi:hypothetical protein
MSNSAIQAVLFPINEFTPKQAKTFLKKHNLLAIKPVHTTANYHRYRLEDPQDFTHFITKHYTFASNSGYKTITLIIGFFDV